jgi:DNA invertase Pin-like site-specific DNA recombinase
MKVAETAYARTDRDQRGFSNRPAVGSWSTKIHARHLEKLAVVYIRQSSVQQVMENRESTARQYALSDYARSLGWSSERVLVIDEDQGQSGATAEHRSGFQRLLGEVTMDHVGMVLGLEMSRLARSSKDWHHLLELCAIFGTLLADQDGVYDAGDPNDRLLLGLKGTMSEVELHTMRNRLRRGALNKAQRGELFHHVPFGYVILPNGKVSFDPDEQAQHVVRLIFEKFDEIGTIYSLFHWLVRHEINLPIRARMGRNKGELEWRRPSLVTLCQMLHHPIYAGAYAYGRRPHDPKAKYSTTAKRRRRWMPKEEWLVLIKDRLPAYITWERYENNLNRLKANRRGNESAGAPGQGTALLSGVLACGNCGKRLKITYQTKHSSHYTCVRHLLEAKEQSCYGLKATEIDQLVTQQVLLALSPASLELSMKAVEDVEKERASLDTHWKQKLKRAQYEVDLAERRYRAVDPDNRLVAASLEKQWEEALLAERQLEDDYDRFLRQSSPQLTADERARIESLTRDIPALWHAAGTTNADRKEIVRCLIDRVVVHVKCDSEYVDATIHWKGGYASQHGFIRPVATYAQLRDFEVLLNRVVELRERGHVADEIAKILNREGFSPPKRRGEFTSPVVYQLLKRRNMIGRERSHDELLGEHEWWVADLARELQMSAGKLRDWGRREWVHARQTPIQNYWVVWADDEELKRLLKLLAKSRRGINAYSSANTTPKSRPQHPAQ